MNRSVTLLRIVLPSLLLVGLGGCATTEKWSAAGGDREQGLVKVSYEYPEFHQPEMSDTQAESLALNRCNDWGFAKAEPIAGQIRQCANVEGGNCTLWTVTREFQCGDGEGHFATRLSR